LWWGIGVSDAALADVSRYYDTLHFWTQFNKGFRRFSGTEIQAIHRWLDDPATGEFSPATIHKLILSCDLPANGSIEALDAGCGYGGTMFALHASLGGRWRGVTVSPRQYAVGRRSARERGLADTITFARQSYDAPQPGSYNLIVAIESLVHSTDPARSIGNLVRALRTGGTMIVVDDMPEEKLPDAAIKDLVAFKTLWRCPVMASSTEFAELFDANGCDVIETRDLSNLMRPRSEPEIAQALTEVAGRRRWRDWFGLRRVGEAEIGGLLLERLGRAGAVRYTMMVARKR
jgi:SAM-dependent methyltransferase